MKKITDVIYHKFFVENLKYGKKQSGLAKVKKNIWSNNHFCSRKLENMIN